MTNIGGLFEKIVSVFSTYSIVSDTLDLLLLTFLFYSILKMIRDSRALTFAKGIFVFLVVYGVVLLLNMQASAYLFQTVFDNILLILVVIFAPEIRKLLENMGATSKAISSIRGFLNRTSSNQKSIIYNERVDVAVNELFRAVSDMSDKKIGALMVFEKETPLGEIVETGTIVNAEITSEMIGNVFYPKAPLHDGAAIIRDCKLYAAGCILPLTSKNNISSDLGTRHRAAIGMSEQSDALVLVVSEETGAISIAQDGKLQHDITDGAAREQLLNFLKMPVVGGDKHGK
ncbi:MAG: diadenylate cyclase CdaA [Clostridia bacterium]|nr:diadenylate cyclase CdaA [Candidatus Limimonas egerieequi]MCQ2489471.1 diadenylate cyclase CdaA [Clostridia bacterium]